MQKISSHLWFDKEAKEAAEFYTSVFGGKILTSSELHNTPSGDVDVLSIELLDHHFMLISAGPLFKFTPATSFLVACSSKEEVETYWNKLSEGSQVLMELNEYPFSEKYGWLQDKYGLSWQIMYMPEAQIKQRIIPTLMFVGDVVGKAEEAITFYASVFKNSEVGDIMRYEKGEEPDQKGTVKHASFKIENQYFAAMDSARMHDFNFNEAISFVVHCENQEEIDYYWEKLSAVAESEQCGWLKDKYGVSWQIEPIALNKMMLDPNEKKVEAVTQAFLKMKKFDIAELQKAFDNA